MKRWHIMALAIAVLSVTLTSGTAAATGTRLGGGLHYWKTLDKVDVKDVDENGLSWIVSFQYGSTSIVKLQTELEIFPKRFGGTEHPVYAPCALVLAGKTIYGGLGIGTYYYDGEFADKPFYVLSAGVDLELLPSIYLDINANYRWESWRGLGKALKDVDTDTITLGAAVGLAF
jgi:hypothetical protein